MARKLPPQLLSTSLCSPLVSTSLVHLMKRKHYLSQFKLKAKPTRKPLVRRISQFKLINMASHTHRDKTSKKSTISLSRFKLVNNATTSSLSPTKQLTKQQLENRRNLYKLNNIKSIRRIIINKRFKLVKENEKYFDILLISLSLNYCIKK